MKKLHISKVATGLALSLSLFSSNVAWGSDLYTIDLARPRESMGLEIDMTLSDKKELLSLTRENETAENTPTTTTTRRNESFANGYIAEGEITVSQNIGSEEIISTTTENSGGYNQGIDTWNIISTLNPNQTDLDSSVKLAGSETAVIPTFPNDLPNGNALSSVTVAFPNRGTFISNTIFTSAQSQPLAAGKFSFGTIDLNQGTITDASMSATQGSGSAFGVNAVNGTGRIENGNVTVLSSSPANSYIVSETGGMYSINEWSMNWNDRAFQLNITDPQNHLGSENPIKGTLNTGH